MRADIKRTSTFGILLRPLQTYLIRLFNSFSSQIASHCSGVFGFGTRPLSDGMILPGTAKFLSGFEHPVLDPLDQHKHLVEVFVRFGRQADHHIELDGQHSAIENGAADIDDLVVGQILVDDAAQPVGAGFWRDGDLLIA